MRVHLSLRSFQYYSTSFYIIIIILPQETHAPQLRRLLDAGLQRLPWNQYLRLANDANGSQALRIVPYGSFNVEVEYTTLRIPFFAREQVQSTLPTGMDDAHHQDLFRCWDVQSFFLLSYGNMSNRPVDPKWRRTPVEQVKPHSLKFRFVLGPAARCHSEEKSRLYHTKLLEERVAESIRKAAENSSNIIYSEEDPCQNREAKRIDSLTGRSSILWLLLADWWFDTITSELR